MKIHPESSRELKGRETISNYIYGGNAVVKLEAPSGKSHTYVFSKPRNTGIFPDDVLFVYALHEGVQQFYVGMVENRRFRLTQNSRFLPDTEIVRGAAYIMRMANTPGFQTPMKLYHMGICSRCGRHLTSEDSLETGIGPKCRKLLDNESVKTITKI